jgi:hypothetical protein
VSRGLKVERAWGRGKNQAKIQSDFDFGKSYFQREFHDFGAQVGASRRSVEQFIAFRNRVLYVKTKEAMVKS